MVFTPKCSYATYLSLMLWLWYLRVREHRQRKIEAVVEMIEDPMVPRTSDNKMQYIFILVDVVVATSPAGRYA